jgi:hypothetical protein
MVIFNLLKKGNTMFGAPIVLNGTNVTVRIFQNYVHYDFVFKEEDACGLYEVRRLDLPDLVTKVVLARKFISLETNTRIISLGWRKTQCVLKPHIIYIGGSKVHKHSPESLVLKVPGGGEIEYIPGQFSWVGKLKN